MLPRADEIKSLQGHYIYDKADCHHTTAITVLVEVG
jgi:hypothetical protein